MTEASGEVLRAPSEWDSYEDSHWKWDNITMRDLIYSDLPAGADEAIESVIAVSGCKPRHLKRVDRVDGQTLEIVWYDDAGAPEDEDYYATNEEYENAREPTKVPNRVIDNARDRVHEFFGPHWRVSRKPDDRRRYDDHPQRALVRRADHQRFQYKGETAGEYQIALNGRPDNAPEDVMKYGDLEQYPLPPLDTAHGRQDVYVYDSGTGTKHLIQSHELRDSYVAVEVDCHCSISVEPEDVVDGEGVEHYAEWLRGQPQPFEKNPRPGEVIGDDLCSRCWKGYARKLTSVNGKVIGYEAPGGDYYRLLDWDGETDHDH